MNLKEYDRRELVNSKELELFQVWLIDTGKYLDSIDSSHCNLRQCRVRELQMTLDKLNDTKDRINRHIENIKTLL